MLRDRLLARTPLFYGLIAWGILVGLVPAPAVGAPLPPQLSTETHQHDLEVVRQTLELRTVQAQLEALGVAPAEVEAKLGQLSPDEVHQLAQRADEVRAGGDGASALAFVLLVLLLVIVILELMGRKVISR